MIRINLAPTKRYRHEDRSQQELLLGFLVVLLAGAAIFFLVDKPVREDIGKLQETVDRLERQNREKDGQLKNYKKTKDAVAEMEKHAAMVTQLNEARATPAHMLYELATLLTKDKGPTVTNAMSKEIDNNPNRLMTKDWDAKHVWVKEFKEKGGEFILKGGAQSDSDMTQLALRMQASVFFHDVVPDGGVVVVDRETGISYYQFTIKGKVAY